MEAPPPLLLSLSLRGGGGHRFCSFLGPHDTRGPGISKRFLSKITWHALSCEVIVSARHGRKRLLVALTGVGTASALASQI